MAVEVSSGIENVVTSSNGNGASPETIIDIAISVPMDYPGALFSGDIVQRGNIAEVCVQNGAGDISFSDFYCSTRGMLKANMVMPEGFLEELPERSIRVGLPASTYFTKFGRTTILLTGGIKPNVLSMPVENLIVRQFVPIKAKV